MARAVKKVVKRRKEPRNRPKPQSRVSLLKQRWVWGAVALLSMVTALGYYLWEYGTDAMEVPDVEIEVQPITARQASLAGKITHVQPQQISALVNAYGKVGLLALDPEQLRIAMESLPWIYRARVRKVWPDRLDLWVEEQRPAVRWGEQGYLNLDGIYFDADGIDFQQQPLPLIDAPQQDTVAVYQQLQRLTEILSVTSPAAVARMEVDQRGAVSIYLRSGLAIHLGRRAIEKRLRRWMAQSTVVMSRFKDQVNGVDLRYERGMVLQLKSKPSAKKGKKR